MEEPNRQPSGRAESWLPSDAPPAYTVGTRAPLPEETSWFETKRSPDMPRTGAPGMTRLSWFQPLRWFSDLPGRCRRCRLPQGPIPGKGSYAFSYGPPAASFLPYPRRRSFRPVREGRETPCGPSLLTAPLYPGALGTPGGPAPAPGQAVSVADDASDGLVYPIGPAADLAAAQYRRYDHCLGGFGGFSYRLFYAVERPDEDPPRSPASEDSPLPDQVTELYGDRAVVIRAEGRAVLRFRQIRWVEEGEGLLAAADHCQLVVGAGGSDAL